MLLISEKWHLYSVRYAGKPLTSDTIDPPVVGQNINMKPCPYPFQYLFPGVRALGQSAFDPISVTCYLGSLALRNWFRFRACMCDKHSYECIRTGITHLHILSYLSSVVAEIIALTIGRSTRRPFYLNRGWQGAVLMTTYLCPAMRYCARHYDPCPFTYYSYLTVKQLSPAFQLLSTESRHNAVPVIVGTMTAPGTPIFVHRSIVEWHGIDYSSITRVKSRENHLMFITHNQQYGFQTRKYTYLIKSSCLQLWLQYQYNAVQSNMIILSWLRRNINQWLSSQLTPLISTSRVSYGVSIVGIF